MNAATKNVILPNVNLINFILLYVILLNIVAPWEAFISSIAWLIQIWVKFYKELFKRQCALR